MRISVYLYLFWWVFCFLFWSFFLLSFFGSARVVSVRGETSWECDFFFSFLCQFAFNRPLTPTFIILRFFCASWTTCLESGNLRLDLLYGDQYFCIYSLNHFNTALVNFVYMPERICTYISNIVYTYMHMYIYVW